MDGTWLLETGLEMKNDRHFQQLDDESFFDQRHLMPCPLKTKLTPEREEQGI
ncbi:hypothetical protein J9317_19955 [Metabacillus sp. KIGAM252]|uniref:Uncharacterized protein n=1 Tax=Metabacillus flavus TaxID=2823519 RepID=A0ABS5LJX0_9BACI|nr:hypothetical protein [Metabacillus flavus]MBS2971022.1 hypothetical protein [Metabacillus flavus]